MINSVSNPQAAHSTQIRFQQRVQARLSGIKKLISQDKRPTAVYGGEWDLRVRIRHPEKSLRRISRSMTTAVSSIAPLMQFIERGSSNIHKSKLNHEASNFTITMDDVPELHFKPGTLKEIESATQKYSHYLNSTLKSDLIGGAEHMDHGLHVHIDIQKSFKTAQDLGRCFTLLFNVAPAVKASSRLNPESGVCLSLDDEFQTAASGFLQSLKNDRSLKRESVMLKLLSALAQAGFYDKNFDVNLQHRHFGKEGTIELRFFQSPRRPEDIHTLISFVDAMVKFAHQHHSHPVTNELNPEKYTNVYQLLDLFCSENPLLRQKLISLFEYKELKPVSCAAYPPDHWRTRIAEAVKMDDAVMLQELLSEHKPESFDIDGIDPKVYAQHNHLNAVQHVLRAYNLPKLESAEDSIQFYSRINAASDAGLDKLQQLRLFREPEHVINKVIEAQENNESVANLNTLISMTPAQHAQYDLLIQQGLTQYQILNELTIFRKQVKIP